MESNPTSSQEPSREFGKIALSLSGGGVRAVGFHLGLLSMLERLDLLHRISILSTVSGGSLTGTGYALSQRFGHSFDRFFGEFYEFLPQINTIETLLQGLAAKEPAALSGRRDMIAVLANLYDDAYFAKYFGADATESDPPNNHSKVKTSPRFDVFWNDENPDNHLKEVIFNATEFQTGAAFRFQKSEFRNIIGNANIMLCEEHARQLRMADIMAASCCIPVGMEPMFFPDDFHWPDDTGAGKKAKRPTCDAIKQSLRNNLHRKFRIHSNAEVDFFALMDGGVYDNQGIVSMVLAMNRLITKIPANAKGECFCGESLSGDVGEPGAEEWANILAGRETESVKRDSSNFKDVGWEEVELLIISDTPVRRDSLYPRLPASLNRNNPEDALHLDPPFSSQPKGSFLTRLTIGGVERIVLGLGALLVASAFATFLTWAIAARPVIPSLSEALRGLLQVGVPLVVTTSIGVGLFILHRRLASLSNKLYAVLPRDRWNNNPWRYVKKLKISDLITMLSLRISSTAALTSSIYMDRIRSLSYSALFSRRDLKKHVITNEIFDLEQCQHGRPLDWPEDFPAVVRNLSEDASAIITLAAHMPTKLWINRIDKGVPNYAKLLEGDNPITDATRRVLAMNEKRAANSLAPLTDLDVLVISGQLTSCFNLMVHLWKQRKRDGGAWTDADSEEIFEKAVGLWKQFHDDPTGLLSDQQQRCEEARASQAW